MGSRNVDQAKKYSLHDTSANKRVLDLLMFVANHCKDSKQISDYIISVAPDIYEELSDELKGPVTVDTALSPSTVWIRRSQS